MGSDAGHPLEWDDASHLERPMHCGRDLARRDVEPILARSSVVPASDRPFALLANGVTVGGMRLPGPLADGVLRAYDPFRGLGRQAPFRVEVGGAE